MKRREEKNRQNIQSLYVDDSNERRSCGKFMNRMQEPLYNKIDPATPYGPGVRCYFDMQLKLLCVFAILSVLSIPMIVSN